MVLWRGHVPAEVLFIGEAPGQSEDVLGYPFVGEAGKILDQIIRAVDMKFTYAITNVVACAPIDADDTSSGTFRQPKGKEAAQCRPRLLEFIRLASPRIIVTLGQVARKYFPADELPKTIKVVPLIHPAAVLRMTGAKYSLEVKRMTLTLRRTLEELDEED